MIHRLIDWIDWIDWLIDWFVIFQSRQQAAKAEFTGHIVICVLSTPGSQIVGLHSFVLPLRSAVIKPEELREIVILSDHAFMRKVTRKFLLILLYKSPDTPDMNTFFQSSNKKNPLFFQFSNEKNPLFFQFSNKKNPLVCVFSHRNGSTFWTYRKISVVRVFITIHLTVCLSFLC